MVNPSDFRNPPKQYRPAPFWSWNDDLKPEELRRQVRDMKEQGYGGYFMHSRAGLATEYLSERWMECIAACLDEGRKVGMESWLYDEDRWPSGFAGGLVPEQNDDYISRSLQCHNVEAAAAGEVENVLYAFDADIDDKGRLPSFAPADAALPAGAGRRLLLTLFIPKKSGRYNMQAYVDLLNPEVTEAFLKCTHDAYHERFGKEYGEFMPGIFSDEPNYSSHGGVPWTAKLPERFREWNGYDLIAKLPLVFYDGDGCAKVRYDFWRTVTRLFIESFTLPMSRRCEQQGLAFTGHYLAEETFSGQIRTIGAAMPHYEFMQIPGIDYLRREIKESRTLKQVASAAEQFGRRRVLCEIFGTSGQSMSFEDQKWIADFHFALGVNFMDPHLTLYSMIGRNKRDFPPTFSYHQPWWPYMRLVNDYLARCAMVVQQGASAANILVLHPIASAWTVFRAAVGGARDSNPEVERYDGEFENLTVNLLSMQRDFHYGDETIMANHARVEGDEFVVGRCRYRVVIVPPSLNWSSKTMELLREFKEAGGRILCVGERPTLVDGETKPEFARLLQRKVAACNNEQKSLRKALDKLLPADMVVTGPKAAPAPSIRCQHRIDDNRHIYFFCNISRTETVAATILLEAEGSVVEWRAEDGVARPVSAGVRKKHLVLEHVFPPVGSWMIVVDPETRPELVKAPSRPREEIIPLGAEWRHQRLHPNSLTLDYARGAVNDEAPGRLLPIHRLRRQLNERLGLAGYDQCQPWMMRRLNVEPDEDATVRLIYEFNVKALPKACSLVLEQADRGAIRVNGQAVDSASDAWHWDRQFTKIDIARQVIEGRNEVEVSFPFKTDTDIEDAYLIGDFGAFRGEDGRYFISAEPRRLQQGDWVPQGYAFYAGAMVCEQEVEIAVPWNRRAIVRLRDPKGTLFRVRVNGNAAGNILWEPWECDITDLLEKGANAIAIEVVGSLRNTMGPLHNANGEAMTWTGPRDFEDESSWTDDYIFAPYGLIGGAEIAIV